jgi:hypothetical protein
LSYRITVAALLALVTLATLSEASFTAGGTATSCGITYLFFDKDMESILN